METKISPTELAKRLTDILERVRGGERIVVERDGEPIATITSSIGRPGITARELVARVGDLGMPGDGFADDLEAIQAAQRPVSSPEWPD